MSESLTENPSDDLTEEDAANIGRAFMERLPKDYNWSDSPAEIIAEMSNTIYDLRETLTSIAAEGCAKFRDCKPPRWCEVCVWCRAKVALEEIDDDF